MGNNIGKQTLPANKKDKFNQYIVLLFSTFIPKFQIQPFTHSISIIAQGFVKSKFTVVAYNFEDEKKKSYIH